MINQKYSKSFTSRTNTIDVDIVNSHSRKIRDDFLQTVVEDILLGTQVDTFRKHKHRKIVSDVISSYFDDLVREDKVVNYKVIFDHRNNLHFINKDTFNIDISFMQRHCIIQTVINITVHFHQVKSSPSDFQLILT